MSDVAHVHGPVDYLIIEFQAERANGSMVEAVLGLPEEAQQECGFVWVVGEEVDHVGASVAGAAPLWTSEWMVMGEPTQNRLATGQRGILKIAIETTGQAGHSAFEEAGHSALEPLLDILTALRAAGWPSDPLLGATRFNIGVLHAGVAANVYPPNATAELLFRAVSDPAELLEEVERRVASRAVVRLLASNPPVKLA
jgi:acetylornithine deacetylase